MKSRIHIMNHSTIRWMRSFISVSTILVLALSGTWIYSDSATKREMGEFVRDISIPELTIQFPKILKERLGTRMEFQSLEGGFFPMQSVEVHFYSGEFPDIATETQGLLYETWKLGGTPSLPGKLFLARLEFLGVKLSWKSGYEKSVMNLSYLERDEEEVFKIVEEWLLNPRFERENLEIARGQLREVIKRRDDSVASLGIRKSKERFYKGHLRGRSESLESLDKVGLADLESYYKRLLGSSQIKVLFSGSNNKDKSRDYWKGFLSKTQEFKNLPYSDIDYANWKKVFRGSERDIHLIDKTTNQAIVVMTGIMPPHNHPDFYAIQLLNYILGGGGFNSYFMTEIRNNRGLAYSTTSHVSFEKTHGIFLAYSLTKVESINEVVDLMKSLLSTKTVNGITEFELTRAKNAIVNQFVFLFENRASILTNQVRFDDHDMPPNYLEIYRDKIMKVSLEDIRRVGREYFDPSMLRTNIVAPSSVKGELLKLGDPVRVVNP